MARYSKDSADKLAQAAPDLQVIFNQVIRYFDHTIIYSYRSPDLQFRLFKQGRVQDSQGNWMVVDRTRVVTNCDGVTKKSTHNDMPSRAVDAAPYPINWSDTERLYYFAGYVMATANRLYEAGLITHRLRFGGDWDNDTNLKDQVFNDLLHFELID